MKKYLLKLYVTGETPRAKQTIANVRRICNGEFCDQYELKIIDILKQPQLADSEKVLATPTLIKEKPHPARRIIGDMSDKEKVLLGLDLKHNVE